MSTQKHSVVVVGGSVGGLRTAALLARDSYYEVALISKKKTFDYHSSIYRDKKGRSRRHLTIPLQNIFHKHRKDLDLIRAEISKIDPTRQVISSEDGIEYPYDSLIVALEGESRRLNGIDGEAVYNAYSASRMGQLRRRLIAEFEKGAVQPNYVVIGAGETGVEMAYELRRLLTSLAKRYDVKTSTHISIIERSARILPLSSPKVSRKVEKRLTKRGIDVYTNLGVRKYLNGRLLLSDGSTMQAPIVMTAAGRRANHFYANNSDVFLLDDDDFVRVNSLQEAEGYNNIYIIGNGKSSELRYNTSGKLYDAHYIVNLLDCKHYSKEIPEYDPPGYEVRLQLGRSWAVYETARRTYSGLAGWLRKRWLDRSHFSTLLPTRLWLKVWLFGSQHDEIQ